MRLWRLRPRRASPLTPAATVAPLNPLRSLPHKPSPDSDPRHVASRIGGDGIDSG